MNHRKLRIAWSVAWGVIAVLLCVLWVRSYWSVDAIWQEQRSGRLGIASLRGTIVSGRNMVVFKDENPFGPGDGTWWIERAALDEIDHNTTTTYGFAWTDDELAAPHWFLAPIIAAIAAAPWFGWRFSLRTLLIATTVIAVGLGVIVWMSRRG